MEKKYWKVSYDKREGEKHSRIFYVGENVERATKAVEHAIVNIHKEKFDPSLISVEEYKGTK